MGGYKRAHHAAVYPPTQEPDQHIPARRLTDPRALLLARAKLLSPVLVRHHCAGRPLFPVRLFFGEKRTHHHSPGWAANGKAASRTRTCLLAVRATGRQRPRNSLVVDGCCRPRPGCSRFRYSYPAAVFNRTEQLGRMAPEESNALHEFREDALVGVVKDLIFFLK